MESPEKTSCQKAEYQRLVESFRKRFSAKVCLFPGCNRSDKIVAAHALSRSGVLGPISRDGHVYAPVADHHAKPPESPAKICLRGTSQVSVFNGFCAHHDKDVFSPIENAPFRCSHEQVFLYAYRSVGKERYLKRKQAESIPTPEEIAALHGIDSSLEVTYTSDMVTTVEASLRGAEDIERHKARLDLMLKNCEWTRLRSVIIPLRTRPSVVCSYVYAPDYDFDGNVLQDFMDLDRDLSFVYINVIPWESGGFAFLSYIDQNHASAPGLIGSLLARKDLTSSLIWMILCHSETFAISPEWWESLADERREKLTGAFVGDPMSLESRGGRLSDACDGVDDWGAGEPFWM